MFILTQNHYNLTDECGNGYFITGGERAEEVALPTTTGIPAGGKLRIVSDETSYVIKCYANDAAVFAGTEVECVCAMKRLALSLRAGQWYGVDWIDGPVLVDVRAIVHGTESTRLETLDLLSEDLSDNKGAQKALHATARALTLHKAAEVRAQVDRWLRLHGRAWDEKKEKVQGVINDESISRRNMQ